MKRSAPLLLVLLATAAGAESLLPPPARLESFAELVMSSTGTPDEIEEASKSARREIQTLADRTSVLVYEGQRLFLHAIAERGFVRVGTGSIQRAEDLLEAGADRARQANSLRPTSEGHRVLADCLNQLLQIRGIAYKILNLGAARTAAEKAVELDEHNALAHVSAAAYFMSVPPAVGGDPDRAAGHLAAAARISPGTPFAEFLIALWTFTYETEFGTRSSADAAYTRAHAIFPHNWLLVNLAD